MSTIRSILDDKGWKIHAVGGDVTVFDAVSKMCRSHIGALLVNDNGKPIGIVSERDIMCRVVLSRRDPSTTSVADVMTHELAFVLLEATPEDAMALMIERSCRHLPVLADGHVVGMISMGDLVRWTNRNHEHEIRALQEYVSGAPPP
jgi:signal-transduction protein with cAMP-binding, CBS, and nucleotidyltransferase domain